MKLESLLALYLYQKKKLNLPGIGTFEAANEIAVPEDNDKHPARVEGITFQSKFVPEPDDDFIEFIKTHTGKMKPLAISDLESYLMLSKQFLNIGKPFYIEGIGTLQKVNDGSLQFTPGEYVSTKLEPPSLEKHAAAENKKVRQREEHHDYSRGGSGSKKALMLFVFVATIALIGVGGYFLYKSNTPEDEITHTAVNSISPITDSSNNTTNVYSDSLTVNSNADTTSSTMAAAPVSTAPGNYKFIMETTASKNRALTRHAYVNKISRRIQLEAKADSSLFKIFVVLPASPADTARIKDSLNAWYYGKKEMKIKIEQ